MQVEASGKAKELFPNLTDADRVIMDLTGSEDEEAGDLGVPITQAEDEEEEWVDWVDWGQARDGRRVVHWCWGLVVSARGNFGVCDT